MVDIIAILVIAVSVMWGYLRGALRNLLTLGALVAAYVGSAQFGQPLGKMLVQNFDFSSGTAYVLARLGAGLAIFISLMIAADMADRIFGKTEQGITRRWNRRLGAAAGLATGAATVLVGLILLDAFYKAFPESRDGFLRIAEGSKLRALVSSHNPADRYLLTDMLRLLRAAQDDPVVLERLRERQEVRQLLDEPKIAAVLSDEALVEDLREHRYHEALRDEDLRRLMSDTDVLRRLISPDVAPDLGAIIREVMEERRADLEEGGEP